MTTSANDVPSHLHKPKARWKDMRIRVLIMEAKDFIIGLDESGEIDWAVSDQLDEKLDQKLSEWGAVLNRVSELQNVPVDHLTTSQIELYRLRIGEGLCRALQLDFKNSLPHLDGAESFWLARSREKARLWYLSGSVATFLVIAIVSGVIWALRGYAESLLGSLVPEFIICCCAGAFGALLSILLRVGNSPLEVAAGRRMHLVEGGTRIAVGWGAALIAISAQKLQLVLPQLTKVDHPLLAGIFICLVAGTSERLVPTIVRQVEIAVSKTDMAPPKLKKIPRKNAEPQDEEAS